MKIIYKKETIPVTTATTVHVNLGTRCQHFATLVPAANTSLPLTYTQTTETRPTGGGDDDARSFLLSAYCFIPLLLSAVVYMNQPEELVAKEYYLYKQ